MEFGLPAPGRELIVGIYLMTMQLAREVQGIHNVQILPNGTVLVEYGPMRMFINVYMSGNPVVELAREGAYMAIKVLKDLARFLPVIREKAQGLEIREGFPDVVRRMIEATKKMEEPDLTPLASVAGAASDVVADFIFSQGGTKIIVDNGGDIAIRLREGEMAKVGVKTDIDSKHPTYLITIDSTMGIGGVATSGLGGRSFTKGIASAVTVLSENASLADAAATAIGNRVKTKKDIYLALEEGMKIKDILGVVIILADHFGAIGDVELVKI